MSSLCSYVVGLKNDGARQALWELTNEPAIRGQALIDLAWIGHPDDLAPLGAALLASDRESGSPDVFSKSYGSAAVPYLLKVIEEGQSPWLQVSCARALAGAGRVEGFVFLKDAIENSRPYKDSARQVSRDDYAHSQTITDQDLIALLDRKIAEASGHK